MADDSVYRTVTAARITQGVFRWLTPRRQLTFRHRQRHRVHPPPSCYWPPSRVHRDRRRHFHLAAGRTDRFQVRVDANMVRDTSGNRLTGTATRLALSCRMRSRNRPTGCARSAAPLRLAHPSLPGSS